MANLVMLIITIVKLKMLWVGKYANPQNSIVFSENQDHLIVHRFMIHTNVLLVDFKFLIHGAKIIKVIINTIYIYTYNYNICFYGNNYDKNYNHYAKDFLTLVFIPYYYGLRKKESNLRQ